MINGKDLTEILEEVLISLGGERRLVLNKFLRQDDSARGITDDGAMYAINDPYRKKKNFKRWNLSHFNRN